MCFQFLGRYCKLLAFLTVEARGLGMFVMFWRDLAINLLVLLIGVGLFIFYRII
jgi:hypothetical protein